MWHPVKNYLSNCYSSMGPRMQIPLPTRARWSGGHSLSVGLLELAGSRKASGMHGGTCSLASAWHQENPCLCAPASFSKGVRKCHNFTLAGTSQGVRECHTHSSLPASPRQCESPHLHTCLQLTREESANGICQHSSLQKKSSNVLTSPADAWRLAYESTSMPRPFQTAGFAVGL